MIWQNTINKSKNLDSWFIETENWAYNVDYSKYEKGIVEIVSKIRKLLLKAKKFPNLRQEIKYLIVDIASKRKLKDLKEMNYEPAGQEVFSATMIPTWSVNQYDRNWRKNLKR
tara:strand:- start:7086 stop:7424 length:339 start_codon:yes stop_codon:yes gene_type:complete